jgi:DNA-binding winged helix-turn-helix (wHTH) protein
VVARSTDAQYHSVCREPHYRAQEEATHSAYEGLKHYDDLRSPIDRGCIRILEAFMVTIRSAFPLPQARRLTPNSAAVSRLCEESQSDMLNRSDGDFPSIDVRRRPRTAAEHFAAFIAFVRFRLYPSERLLLAGDKPMNLGCRALDLPIAPLERPGEVMSKQKLIAWIWAGLAVEESNLKVQIAMLSQILRDGQSGRYISTVNCRGYCFVAPIVRYDGTSQNAKSTPKLLNSGRELFDSFAADTLREPFVAIIVDARVARSIIAMVTECRGHTRFVSTAASTRSAGIRA